MSLRARAGRLPTLLAVLMALFVFAAPTLEPTVATAADLRTILNEIEEEVMCPVCGTLLALAESPQATREKAFVEKLAKEGKDKNEIKEALVNQYGDAVLALPKTSGFTLSAYVVPIVAFIVAVILLAFAVWKWRKAAGRRDDRKTDLEGPSDEDRERLDEDLARYDL
jgi:cytochrome c-type biogenesis protein CcmH